MSNNPDPLHERLQQLEKIAQEYARMERLIDAAASGQNIDHYSGQGMLYVDPTTHHIIDANDSALALLGYSREDILNLSIDALEVLTPDTIIKTSIKNLVEVETYHCSYRHQQGYLLPVEVRRRQLLRKNEQVLHYTLENISLYRRLWRELHRRGDTEAIFQHRLKALNELTIELSRIESFDSLCWHIVKLGVERLGFDRLGLWFLDAERGVMVGSYGIDEQGQMRDERNQCWAYDDSEVTEFLAGKTDVAMAFDEVRIYNEQSQVIEYGWHITAPLLHGERFIGILASDNYLRKQIMKDYEPELLRLYGITAGHLTELTRTREQAFAVRLEQERSRMLRQFITHVGHDFRTPLATINTKSYLIKRVKEQEQREALVSDINEQVSYISTALDRMLEFIALESDPALMLAPTDLRTLVADVVTTYQTVSEAKHIHTNVDAENAAALIVDSRYLRRALSEIYENAVLYTPEGGQIHVSFARYPHDIGIRIHDTGIGLEPEALDRVFKPLYRVDEARTERRSGLGLAIAKAIIEAHHGRITVQSAPGAGSTFEVILPQTEPAHPPG